MSARFKRWFLVVLTLILLVALYLIREVLLPFILSSLLVYILAPAVEWLSGRTLFQRPLSRGFSVCLVYLASLLVLGLSFLLIFPPLYQEVLKIAQDLPSYLEQFRNVTIPGVLEQVEAFNTRFKLELDVESYAYQSFENLLSTSEKQIEALSGHAQTLVKWLFSALSTFLVIFIVTGFVLVDLPKIKRGFYDLTPQRHRKAVLLLIHAVDRDLSGTIRGQILICLINGTLTTIALLILQVKFAITIGFIAGVFSLIPVFGAIISSIPAVIIALTQSWMTALMVVLVIIGIHLLEANFLNPKILGHTVELHPSIIVFAIIVGEHFFGVTGLLFGVPVAAILRSIVKYVYVHYFKEEPTEAVEELKI